MKKIFDGLINAGYGIEVVQGYLDMGNIEEAQKHLSVINRQLLKIARDCESKRKSDIEYDKKLKD